MSDPSGSCSIRSMPSMPTWETLDRLATIRLI